MAHQFFKGDWQQERAFSPAVLSHPGQMVWLAGHGAIKDAKGRSLAADFEGQARESFRRIAATLERVGGTLRDIVYMTVYITDVRYGDQFVAIRKEIFGDAFPASALITCTGFAKPTMLVEVVPIAVVAK